MPGSDVLVQIALGVAALAAVLLVLRWAWNSRKREGGTAERAEALEQAVVQAAERDKKARSQRSQSHAEWKKAGRTRRKRRKP